MNRNTSGDNSFIEPIYHYLLNKLRRIIRGKKMYSVTLFKSPLIKKLFNPLIYVVFGTMGNDKAKEETNDWIKTFSPEDAILSLLYAQKEKPINGRLMFVKQLFLLSNEIVPELNEKLKFFAYDFGPYSSVFASTINELINQNIITVEASQSNDTVSYRFYLSEKGKEIAKNSFEKIPEDIQFILKRKRRGWDQLGYTGILKLVYTKFPEYIVASKIKDEVND